MSSERKASRQYYRPFITKTPVICALFLVTISLIVLTEYGCRQIPKHAGIGKFGDAASKASKALLEPLNGKDNLTRRNEILMQSNTTSFPHRRETLAYSSITSTASSGRLTSSTNNNRDTSTSETAMRSSNSDPLPGSGGSETSPVLNSPARTANPPPSTTVGTGISLSNGGRSTPRQNATITKPARPSSDRGKTKPTYPSYQEDTVHPGLTFGRGGYPTPPGSAVAPTSESTTATTKPAPSAIPETASVAGTAHAGLTFDLGEHTIPQADFRAFTSGSTTNRASLLPTSDKISSNNELIVPSTYIPQPTTSSTSVIPFSSSNISPPTTSTASVSLRPLLLTSAGNTFVVAPILTSYGNEILTKAPVLTVVSEKTYVTFVGSWPTQARPTTAENALPTAAKAVQPIATFVNSTGTYLSWSNGGVSMYPQITLEQYICVAFLPLILVILYSIPWRVLDNTIREMEPFYQLHRPEGSLGRDSLCLDYGSSTIFIVPFKAIRRCHLMPLFSSLISVIVLVLAPLSSEAFFVSLGTGCYSNTQEACRATWGVYLLLARTIQIFLAFVASLLLLIIGINYQRTSGVYLEPLSIAGVGMLLSQSPLLNSLSGIDSKISNAELREALQRRRFKLSKFSSKGEIPFCGIILVDSHSDQPFSRYRLMPENEEACHHSVIEDASSTHQTTPARESKLPQNIKEKYLFIISLFIFIPPLVIIIYYRSTSGNNNFNVFMNSRGFGVRFMMAALGLVIKLLWSRIDTTHRKNAPYARLLQGSAEPENTILLPSWQSPLSAIVPSIRRGHYLTASISAIAILTEFLPLLLTNIPFSFGTTRLSYEICNALSITILSSMSLITLVLTFKKPDGVSTLPRAPDTLASVAMYLAGKGDDCVLKDLEGLGRENTVQRDSAVTRLRKRYSLRSDKGEIRIRSRY